MDFKLYSIKDDYINYLRSNVSRHVFSNTEPHYKHTRKYIGAVITVGKYNYYIPMSSPKDTDYFVDNFGVKRIRKSIIPIIRMIEKDKDGNKELLGTLKLSSMIPVPDDELIKYDPDKETDGKYKDIIQKEIRFITRNKIKILNNANVLYKQKCEEEKYTENYLRSTLDFKKLEKACDEYKRSGI